MKHFILTLLVFICAVVTVNRCEAQGPSSYISPTDSNYFQITKQYDRYFKDQDSLIRTGVITLSHADSLLEEDGMRMKYERWKNFWGFRVDEHGSFKTAQTETNYVLDNWNPCRTNTTQDDQISWSNIGPFNSEGARLADDNQGRVDAIDVNPADTNDIIVGAYNGGIWRSRDGGKTWVNTTDDEGYSIYGITSIARHPAYPDVLYATTGTNLDFWGLSTRGYGMGLIYSNDGGNSWYKTDYHADPSTGTDHAHKVVVDPRSGSIISGLVRFPTILYVCNDVTVRTYTGNIDGLGSWTDIPGLPSWGYTWNCAYLGADKFNDMEIKPDGTLWFCNIKGVYTYRAGDATYTTISYPIPPAATVSNTCTGIIYGATTNPEAQFINIEIDRWNNVWLYIDYLVADGISTSHNLGYYYKLQGSDWYISDVVTARNLPHPFKPSINNENVLYQEDVTSYPRLVNKLNFTLSTPYHLSIVSNTMISNAHTDVRAIYLHKNSSMALGIDQIYVGEDGGICKTKDANLWYSISGTGTQGLCNTNYYGLGSWEKDSKFICAGAQDGNINLFVKGKMYETEPDGDNGDCAFVKDNTGVVFQESSGGGGGSPVVCPSTYNSSMHDMNVSSYILPSGAVDKDYIAVPMETGKTHVNDLVVGYQKVFCSHDNGGTWQEVYDATKYNSDHLSIASMALGSSDGAAYIIYFSTYGGDPSLLDRKEQNAIYKATSNTGAAGSWTIIDITDNLRLTDRTDPSHTYLPAPISDISIDPFNPDKIWICFAGFIPEYKVWKRDLSLTGSTWHTVVPPTGSCFPNIPCKSIVYQPINYPYTTTDPYHLDINPERLYVGTDMGVFYFDNSMSDWDYFGIGGPRTMVTDMEINQCGQQLIVSTAGRGLWTADLVPNREYQVLHDEVYVSNFWNDIFDRDIHIFNGATFTINSGTTLNMGRNRKIIVDIGAKLLVNGGIITNDCNAMWEGIIVRGSKTDPQDISSTDGLVAHSYNQGFVFLKDATISNAHEAIRVWNPDDVWVSQNRTDNQGQTGGIVRAENTSFLNNRRSAEFMYYKNFNPISGSTIDNLSYFTHCKFQTDDNHPSDYPFNTHVSMWGVDRIAIKGCSFSNLKTNLTDPLAMGVGINTIDAYLVVRNAITPPLIGGDFFGLTYGIRVQNSSAIFNSQIFQSTFNENTTGIFIQNSNNSQITYNNFTIGTLPISTLDPYTSIVGVGVDRSSQFDFSHNQFYGSHNGMKHVVGQWFTNTSTSDFSENVSISNKFSGISYGTLANYVNKHEDPITHAVSGLQFRCNINTSNTRDFTAYSGTSASIFGIRDNQGSLTNYAGNTFSTHLGTSPLYHHYDNEELNRLFYFVTGPGSIDYPSYPGRPAYFIYRNGAAIGQCPPVIYGTGTSPVGGVFDPAHRLSSSEKDALSASFLSHKNELDGYKSILQSLIDGGDTTLKEQTKFYSSNANTTRSKLLEASPYLSKEVLKEAAFNTEIPDEVLFEILLANPSSAKDDTLMSYLKSGTHNLPDWMVELIENNLNTVTAKSLLELAVSDARENMMSDWRQIYTDVLNDTIGIDHSALRGWLGLLNDIEADYMIVDDLIEQGDYTDADTFMTEIPQNYKLTDNQMDEYDAMLAFNKWRLSVLKNEHSYMKLSTQEKDQLIEMAEAKESSAQKRAQSILNFFYGYNYETYPEFPTEISQRRGAVSETGKNTYSRGTSGIKLYPNPAINTLSIEVNLPKVDKALNLIFTDILGNTVWESHFQTTEFQSTIDVRNWSSGMYRYQLKSNGELLAEGKVIISR